MELTEFGRLWLKALASVPPLNDFIVTRHSESSYAVVHYARKEHLVALHTGTSAEAHRLFKLLLVTRKLTG